MNLKDHLPGVFFVKILENNNKSNNLEELFAFLGVNGAGKSTTISILCGLQKKDSGTVQVNGIETDKAGAQTKKNAWCCVSG